MRCDAIEGYYLQYKDSGRPVEVLDRVNYAFQSEDRTCLIKNVNHVALLLKTNRYRVVGVELSKAEVEAMPTTPPDYAPVSEAPKPRGRPRKGR